jgi:hypothetical protein
MEQHKKFITQLGFCSFLSIVLILLLNTIPVFNTDQILYWISLVIFIIINIIGYFFGLKTANSSNKFDFSNLFIIVTMIKVFIFLLTFVAYSLLVEPSNKLYILPFFALYMIFTTFEVKFLTKIGKEGFY